MSRESLSASERLPYLRVLIAIAHADGVLDEEEARKIEGSALGLGLGEEEMAEVRRDLAAGLDVAQAVAGASFSIGTRLMLLRDATTIAWSDDLVTPEELRGLRALAEALGLAGYAPRIQAWVERRLGLDRDWSRIVEDAESAEGRR